MITDSRTLSMAQRPSSQSLNLALALRYPFQGQGWFARLLPLALIQLLPVIGQLILLGYSVQVVRAVSVGQIDLPRAQWRQAFVEGLKVALAGFIFMIPIFLTGLLVLVGGNRGQNSLTLPLLLVLSLVIAPIGSRLQKSTQPIFRLFGRLVALLPLLTIILTVIAGVSFFIGARNNPAVEAAPAPQIGLPIMITGLMLVFVILTGTLVGAVRLGITNRGIFDAPGTAKLLLMHGRATLLLVLKLALLVLIGCEQRLTGRR